MTTSKLTSVEQKQVTFYSDKLTAVRVEDGRVFIHLRPLVESLGVAWSPQLRRIKRDPVLSAELASVTVTVTEASEQGLRDAQRNVQCLPLDYVSGFLFGINASRVSEDLKDRIILYQRGCYKALSEAFQDGRLTTNFDDLLQQASDDVLEAYQMAMAVVKLARNQIVMESRITSHERWLTAHDSRLEDVEAALGLQEEEPLISEEQASQISQSVKAIATVYGKKTGRNEFGGVYGELYRRYSITGYKMLPAYEFQGAMQWMARWLAELNS